MTGKSAISQTSGQRIAGSDLRSGTNDSAIGAEHERIAAIEHGERRERMKTRLEGAGICLGGMKGLLDGAPKTGAVIGEVLASVGNGLPGIMAEYRGTEVGDVSLAAANLCRERGLLAEGEVVETLGEAMEQRGNAGVGAAYLYVGEMLPDLEKLKAGGALEPCRLRGETVANFVMGFGDQLSRGGWRGSAEVGGKVGDGEVGFMAHGGDHRYP